MPDDGVAAQRVAMEAIYADPAASRWGFHHTKDPLTRFLRDRRLVVALDVLRSQGVLRPEAQTALVVCGGVGGEGTFLADRGFEHVTVSDLSESALDVCRRLDPRLATRLLNAEHLDLDDDSYDLVFVQDGLHHLPRPTLGFTEMLRVARVGAVVIEPHYGLAGSFLGTKWERHGDAVNFVFRWSRQSFEQVTRSYLLSSDTPVIVRRFWDHNVTIQRVVRRLPGPMRLPVARAIYGGLRPAAPVGNMFVGIALKATQGASCQ